MSFSNDIRRFNNKAEKAAEMVFRGSSLEILSAIIRRTPVKTGRLRGNWQTDLNTFAAGTTEDTASVALRNVRRKTGSMKLTDKVTMMNNLPYAQVIERGSSMQAPFGMVRVTVAEWKILVMRKARAIR